jgi:nitric-oxide synthase, bacterial
MYVAELAQPSASPAVCPWTGRTAAAPAGGAADTAAQAAEFLGQLRAERGDSGPAPERLGQIRAELAATGSYEHTADELAWGAKLAWRNTPKCIG